MSASLYNAGFYQQQSAGSYLSARKLLPRVLELIPAKSALDVGCGVGTFARALTELGVVDVLGIDGDYVPRDQLQIPPERFRPAQLAEGFDLGRTFDLVMSLEVAEHLPREASERFIRALTRHSSVVLFSAAVPLQGGTGHINEQWASFWARLFEQCGYRAYDPFRAVTWADKEIEVWYRQNTLLFAHDEARVQFPRLAELKPAALAEIDRIHPQMYIQTATELHKLQSFLRGSHLVEVSIAANGGIELKRR